MKARIPVTVRRMGENGTVLISERTLYALTYEPLRRLSYGPGETSSATSVGIVFDKTTDLISERGDDDLIDLIVHNGRALPILEFFEVTNLNGKIIATEVVA